MKHTFSSDISASLLSRGETRINSEVHFVPRAARLKRAHFPVATTGRNIPATHGGEPVPVGFHARVHACVPRFYGTIVNRMRDQLIEYI